MPKYCYVNEKTGDVVEKDMSMSETHPKQITRKGRVYLRSFVLDHKASGSKKAKWPMWSNGLGVHPDQIKETQEYLAKRGVSAEFNADGDCKVEDNGHRNRLLRARDMIDLDGGFMQETAQIKD